MYFCGKCGMSWRSDNPLYLEKIEFADGHNCPKCNSSDISAEDVK